MYTQSVRLCVCMCMCMWLCVSCTHTHAHTHRQSHTRSQTQTVTHTYTHTHTHTRTHTHTHAHTHAHTHTHTRTRTRTRTRKRTRTHKRAHARTQANTHAHAHAHTPIGTYNNMHWHACPHALTCARVKTQPSVLLPTLPNSPQLGHSFLWYSRSTQGRSLHPQELLCSWIWVAFCLARQLKHLIITRNYVSHIINFYKFVC